MGSAWSLMQSTKTCNNISCAAQSPDLCAGYNVAGIGTFTLFFLTVALTLLFSFVNIVRQMWDRHRLLNNKASEKLLKKAASDTMRVNAITEAVILNFSDQQLITGIAMAVTIRYMFHCDMTAYQYDMVCYLLLCSVTTHLASLLAIDKYFFPFDRSKKAAISKTILLVLRLFGIFISIILTGLILFNRNTNTFPVDPSAAEIGSDNLLLRPAVCFFTGADVQDALQDVPEAFEGFIAKNWSHGLVQYVFFIICICVTIPIAVIHSFERGFSHKLAHPRLLLFLRFGILCIGIAITVWTFVLALNLRQFMHGAGKPADSQSRANENEWTFAQVLSVSILAFSPIEGLNAAADKYDTQKLLDDNGIDLKTVAKAGDVGYVMVQGNDHL